MNRLVTLSSALALSALAASSAVAGPVKISQVYGAAVANNAGNVNGDFVELVNTGAVPVDMSNWAVSIATGTGTYAWTKINIPAGTILQPNRHYTLRLQTLAGGIVYNQDQTGASANLAVGNGAVAVMANQNALTAGTCPTADPDMVDIFGYGTSLCRLGTAAPSTGHTAGSNQAFTRSADGCTNTSDNSADFALAAANPRVAGGLAGTAGYTPATPIQIGQTITFTGSITGVTETFCSGSPAPSTGQTATVDLSEIGGAAGTPMNPLGGGAFTLDFTVPNTATGGNKTVRLVGTDAQGRTVTGVLPVVLAIQPTPDLDFGTLALSPGVYTNSTPLTGNVIKWYKFTVATDITAASNTYLDIDTENSARADATVYDTFLSLFDNTGTLRSSDDDDGSGFHSQLSYGATLPVRPAQATNGGAAGVAYNGRDGTLVAGTYWLAAYGYPNATGSPAAGWIVNSTSAQDGTLQVNMTYGSVTPPAPPTVFFDMGTLATNGTFATHTVGLDPATVKWVKFTLSTAIDSAASTYLDIDTETSTTTATSAICLFRPDGTIAAQDTVDGSGTLSQLSFGAGTRAPYGNSVAYNGRDGATLAAGVYYLAVGIPTTTFGAGWSATSTSANAGDVVVRVRTGTQPPPAPPTVFTDLAAIPNDNVFHSYTTSVTTEGQVAWYRFSVASDVSTAAGTWIDMDTEGSTATATAMCVFDAVTGAIKTQDTVDGSNTLSQISYGAGTRPATGNGTAYNGRDGTLVAGAYYVAVTQTTATFAANWVALSGSLTTGVDLRFNIRYGTNPTPAAPTSFTDLGTLNPNGNFLSSVAPITGPGQVKWFKFTLASGIDRAARTYLDIDTEGSTLTATGICLFDAPTGAIVVQDTVDGTDTLSQISIGRGGRAAPGNGLAYNGRDAATLPAGEYFVAATIPNLVFAAGWTALSNGTETGDLHLNIRTGTQGPAQPPTNNIDLGTLAGDRVIDTEGGNPITITATEIKWYKFTLPTDASTASGKYVDIDTYGSSFDTELGLYDSAGTLKAANDDGAAGLISLLTFGDTANIRPPTAGGTDDFPRDGRNGDLLAGVFYLAVGKFNTTYADDFDVTSAATGSGTLVTNIYTNYPTGPTPCNAADVAGLGGTAGPDHQLTADDIIVYLDAFFSNNLAIADIAVLGGTPGHDGQLTADDLIYFLDQFFRPCNP